MPTTTPYGWVDSGTRFNHHDNHSGMHRRSFLPAGVAHHLRPGFAQGQASNFPTRGSGQEAFGHVRLQPSLREGGRHQRTQSLNDARPSGSRGVSANIVAHATQFAMAGRDQTK